MAITKTKQLKNVHLQRRLDGKVPTGPLKGMKLLDKLDRDDIRPLFGRLVEGKFPDEKFEYYFDRSYKVINKVYNMDIPAETQAQYMAKHVDLMISMEKFYDNRKKQ